MADKPFRVLLDLTDLHVQSFKYVWINVCPREIKTISEFKLSLLHKIKLDYEDIELFVRGGLLLNEETIIILREDDIIKVQLGEETFSSQEHATYSTKQYENLSRKNVSDEYNQDPSSYSKNHKKHIYSVSTDACDKDINGKKKKKRKFNNSLQDDYEETNSEILSGDHKSAIPNCKKKKKKSVVSNEIIVTDNIQNLDSSLSFESKTCSTKKKKCNISCKSNSNDEYDSSNSETKNKNLVAKNISVITKEKRKPNQELQKTNTETITNSNIECNNSLKKKRKRYRKRKKTAESALEEANFDSEFKPFNNVETAYTKRKHTLFTSLQEPNEIICQENAEVITLNDDDDNADVTNLSTSTYVVNEKLNYNDLLQASYPKMSTPTQGNGYSNLKWDVTLMQNENSNFTKDKTLSPQKSCVTNILYESETKSPAKYSEGKEISQVKAFENFPPLNSLPEIGTRIAYKIVELNENYNPVISKFKEGIVTYIDPLTEEMKIEFLKHEIRPGRTGKFENLKEDEVPPPEILKYETVGWSSLIEPKLLLSCPKV